MILLMLAPLAVLSVVSDAAQPIVEAETAFAADVARDGLNTAFRKWSTEDAMVITTAGPQNAHRAYADQDPPGGSPLAWWPSWVAMAASGDLAVSSGPVEIRERRRGHYLSVWRRQPNGEWRWIYDGGSASDSSAAPTAGAPRVPSVGVVDPASNASDVGMTAVLASEAALASAAAEDQAAAHLAVLDDEARVSAAPLAPADDRAGFIAALKAWPTAMTYGAPQGGDVSAAGDLAWTWGGVDWSSQDGSVGGWYVHAWLRRAEGWRLIYAQIIARPPAAPAAS